MADEKRNEEKEKEKEKGFVVRDKRFTAPKEEEKVSPGNEKMEGPLREEVSGEEVPLPEINFTSFILSLSTSALIQLGEIEDPFTKKQSKDLPIAKQTIDLIGMLREKTKGNLTSEEGNFLDNALFDLDRKSVV